MRAGKLRHRCTLYRNERVRDELGGWQDVWVEVRKFWGDINAVSGRVWLSAAQENAQITAEIWSRPMKVTAGMRIGYRDSLYEIEAPLFSQTLNRQQLMCKTVKPDA
ncbi:hypothetical protein BZK31_03380 [Pseudomonas floridensis]|uniref:Head-tail adaptor protein n=1 Tax=Pseudomonas floridensis TaxID=1958950 RepID=A0A1X0NB14_9PSED|nr:phage head closure protein [Pseudomonas floridensis]MEE4626632.1 phage head closure protein [Pseudomonas alliivorans]MEE4740632.1 phage head closure protein [Pseudomonas alliivorans]MEE4804615.1 phage head closure protein [Pseudomonas alliivorans]MEE5107240.1 phage head closure protein [Pseudomonas alliivorans]MEE5153027.1 phage head closure protein [Pseudomonas alliivorans]